jgi:hypothetical protein
MERKEVIETLVKIYDEYGFSKVRDIIDYVNDQDFAIKTMQNKIEELSKTIISLIDYGECDDIGFTIEEIYNNALENIAKGIK